MSEPKESLERFFVRWSRRKGAAAEYAGDETSAKQESEQSSKHENAATSSVATVSDGASATFDPASLPPIELINAASDLRAFLAPGIPVELTRAALRRAWVTDPTIRDFIGIAENQWDFGKPDGVPGFGCLDLTSDLRRIVSELCGDPAGVGQGPEKLGQSLDRGNAAVDTTTAQSIEAPAEQAKQALSQGGNQLPATPTDSTESALDRPAIRKHGRALPG